MAYNNYGGTCRVDNLNKTEENCDVTILELLGLKEKGLDWQDRISHCWVGDKDSTFIIQMYKTYATRVIYIEGNNLGLLDTELHWDYDESEFHYVEVENGGKKITVRMEYQHYPSLLRVEFIDPSGRQWVGKTGYRYGKGFE